MPGSARLRKTKRGVRRWQARWRPPGDGSDKERRTETFGTKDEADDWIADLDRGFKTGNHADPRRGKTPFSQVAAEWIADQKHLEASTHADYSACVRTWMTSERDPLNRRPPFRRGIGHVTAGQIDEWVKGIAANRAHRTMVKNFAVLKQVMAYAVEKGYIAHNPCTNVRTPRKPSAAYDPSTGEFLEDQKPDHVILDRDEIKTLAQAMPTDAYALAVTFDAWMGLRAGELWGLQRRDINLLHGTVSVRRAWKEVNGSFRGEAKRTFLGPLKTAAARRDLHMPKHIWQAVEAHMESIGPDPSAFLFTTPEGAPVRHSTFYDHIFKPAVKAVLPHKSHFRFHDLRHTAASIILAIRPHDYVAVKQRLGHAKIQTTIDIYGKAVIDMDAELAAALDEYATTAAPPLSLKTAL